VSEPSGERKVPFYCPYCGEEDLAPTGPDAGGWECRSCTRAFTLRSLNVSVGAGKEDA
jgi:transposase-like protein